MYCPTLLGRPCRYFIRIIFLDSANPPETSWLFIRFLFLQNPPIFRLLITGFEYTYQLGPRGVMDSAPASGAGNTGSIPVGGIYSY